MCALLSTRRDPAHPVSEIQALWYYLVRGTSWLIPGIRTCMTRYDTYVPGIYICVCRVLIEVVECIMWELKDHKLAYDKIIPTATTTTATTAAATATKTQLPYVRTRYILPDAFTSSYRYTCTAVPVIYMRAVHAMRIQLFIRVIVCVQYMPCVFGPSVLLILPALAVFRWPELHWCSPCSENEIYSILLVQDQCSRVRIYLIWYNEYILGVSGVMGASAHLCHLVFRGDIYVDENIETLDTWHCSLHRYCPL